MSRMSLPDEVTKELDLLFLEDAVFGLYNNPSCWTMCIYEW